MRYLVNWILSSPCCKFLKMNKRETSSGDRLGLTSRLSPLYLRYCDDVRDQLTAQQLVRSESYTATVAADSTDTGLPTMDSPESADVSGQDVARAIEQSLCGEPAFATANDSDQLHGAVSLHDFRVICGNAPGLDEMPPREGFIRKT